MSSAKYLFIDDQSAETQLEVGGELPPDASCQSKTDTIAVVSFGSIFVPPLLWDILSNLFRINTESTPSK